MLQDSVGLHQLYPIQKSKCTLRSLAQFIMARIIYGTCEKYLAHTLTAIWTSLEIDFNINFLSLRKSDIAEYLIKEPEWSDAVQIIEKYGIGSSDSMIINMFMCTNFLMLITSDKEVARVIKHLENADKFVLIPNGLKL